VVNNQDGQAVEKIMALTTFDQDSKVDVLCRSWDGTVRAKKFSAKQWATDWNWLGRFIE
jgi:hypothetical protein